MKADKIIYHFAVGQLFVPMNVFFPNSFLVLRRTVTLISPLICLYIPLYHHDPAYILKLLNHLLHQSAIHPGLKYEAIDRYNSIIIAAFSILSFHRPQLHITKDLILIYVHILLFRYAYFFFLDNNGLCICNSVLQIHAKNLFTHLLAFTWVMAKLEQWFWKAFSLDGLVNYQTFRKVVFYKTMIYS